MKDTILKLAAELYPDAVEYILKVAEELSEEDKEDLVFSNNAILEDTIEQISKNDELLKQASTTSSFGNSARNWAKGVGATALTGITIAALNDLVQNAHSAATRNRNFNKMLEYAPDLKDYDQKKVKAIFDSLHELSGPKVTGLPHIASDFVRQHTELPGGLSNPKNLSDLVGIRRNIEGMGHIEKPKNLAHVEIGRYRMDEEKHDLAKKEEKRKDDEAINRANSFLAEENRKNEMHVRRQEQMDEILKQVRNGNFNVTPKRRP